MRPRGCHGLVRCPWGIREAWEPGWGPGPVGRTGSHLDLGGRIDEDGAMEVRSKDQTESQPGAQGRRHLADQVVVSVGDGSAFGLDVVYSCDGAQPRGTAGPIRGALPLLGPVFFVLYGDSYLECSYASVQDAFEAAGKRALMTVFRNEGRWDTSNVEFHDGRILAYDKVARTPVMQYIDDGSLICWSRNGAWDWTQLWSGWGPMSR